MFGIDETGKLRDENASLRSCKKELEFQVKKLQELLDSALAAKENGCLRGQYCRFCKHSVLIPDGCGKKCVCTYGTCPHFEKEVPHEPD